MNTMEHLKILGHEVEDIVTGSKGVATTVGFDLYGCVQVIVNPGVDKEGKARELSWFDFKRLKVTSKRPVMEQPDFCVVPGGDVRNPVR